MVSNFSTDRNIYLQLSPFGSAAPQPLYKRGMSLHTEGNMPGKIHLRFTFGISTDVCSGFPFLVVARMQMWLKPGSMDKHIDSLSLGSRSMDRAKIYQEIFNSKTGRQVAALEWHRQQSYRDWGSSRVRSPLSQSPPVPWISQLAPPERADFPYSGVIVNVNIWELAWRLIPENHVWRCQHTINLTSKWSQKARRNHSFEGVCQEPAGTNWGVFQTVRLRPCWPASAWDARGSPPLGHSGALSAGQTAHTMGKLREASTSGITRQREALPVLSFPGKW